LYRLWTTKTFQTSILFETKKFHHGGQLPPLPPLIRPWEECSLHNFKKISCFINNTLSTFQIVIFTFFMSRRVNEYAFLTDPFDKCLHKDSKILSSECWLITIPFYVMRISKTCASLRCVTFRDGFAEINDQGITYLTVSLPFLLLL